MISASPRLLHIIVGLLLSVATLSASAQQKFPTPQKAAEALWDASESEDPTAFITLFGADFTQEITSGDAQADRLGMRQLATLMQQDYRLSDRGGRTMLLEIGSDKWPLPFRIVMTDDNAWVFDVDGGKKELLRRRIDRNEDRALKIAQFYAQAQKQYYSMTGMYAAKILSTPGKNDGLYWKVGADGVKSPLEDLVVRARNLGYEREGQEAPLLMGYYYRVLTAQGENAPGKTLSYLDERGRMVNGFALFAYPARYGISGNSSFMVGREGIVYSRDLGDRTEAVGSRMKRFDPDDSWNPISGIPVQGKAEKVITTNNYAIPFFEVED